MKQNKTPKKWDYRLIVSNLEKFEDRKISYYSEKIKGQTYGYDAMVEWCRKMNKEYPTFSHGVQKRSDFNKQSH